MLETVTQRMSAESAALLKSIENRLDGIMQLWLLGVGLFCAVRIATSSIHGMIGPGTVAPFLLLITVPFASMVLALRWLDRAMPQPSFRFARVGRWRHLAPNEAEQHSLYGAGGIMVSLMLGMLLNVPVRALEYLVAMPALPSAVPAWLDTLRLMMTFDVLLLSSLYVIAFVAALRRAPLFPRLLVTVWLVDVAMQLVIADIVASSPGLPGAVAHQLAALLSGNVDKVLVSAALWLPYLLLSNRVNVTYRHRIAG